MRYLSKKHLAVVAAASTDETRYVLCGVKVEETKKGVKTIATNGRMLAIVESTTEFKDGDFPVVAGFDTVANSAKEAIIPNDAIRKALKALLKPKKYGQVPILEYVAVKMAKDVSTLAATDLETSSVIPARNIEGVFPNYEQVVPKTSKFSISFNPALLVSLLEIAEKVAGHGNSVMLHFNGEKDPVKITAKDSNGEHTYIGVGMPMKPDITK